MDWSHIELNWPEYQRNARNRWSKLSDESLAATQGKREALASRVRKAYALSEEDTEKQVAAWQDVQYVKMVLAPEQPPQA